MEKKSKLIIYYLLIILIYNSYQSSEDCASLDNDKCGQYTPDGNEGTKQCLPVGNEGKCVLKSCEELLSSECPLYTPIGEGANIQNCIKKNDHSDGESQCELKKCNQMEVNRCFEFETKSNEYKCFDSIDESTGESQCSYLTCSSLGNSNYCGDIIYEDKQYQCVENKKGDGCEKKNVLN